jgi:hypothetical protein
MVAQQFDAYSRQLTLCMMTYQFIEYSIRFCLHRCHATIKYRLDGFLAYEAPFQAVEDAALGRLIDWYKGFTTNQALIGDLRGIKGERDRIVHQGYMLTLEEQHDDVFLQREAEKLQASHAKAKACLEALQDEMKRTDEIINRVFSEYRVKREAEGTASPPTPTIEGVTNDSAAAP